MGNPSLVLLLALALMPMAAFGQDDPAAEFAEFERPERVAQACIGGPPDGPAGEFDLVRQFCCSIPRLRLAGPLEGIDPCPLPESAQGSAFRNSFVMARAGTEEMDSEEMDFPPGSSIEVSNTRIWSDGSMEGTCFCPITECPADPPMLPSPSPSPSSSPSPKPSPSYSTSTSPYDG